MKSSRASALVLAGAVGLAGLGLGTVIGPGPATAATSSVAAVGDRVTAIKNALAGLVKDGTLTQAQADKVATTLDGALPAHGGHGRGFGGGVDLETAASTIGVSAEDLRTALQGGKTLVEVAKEKGVSQDTLVSKLVAAATTRLAEAVTAGRLTQEQADTMTANLQERITQAVTSTRPTGGRGDGGGRGGRGGFGQGDPHSEGGSSTPAPSASPSSAT